MFMFGQGVSGAQGVPGPPPGGNAQRRAERARNDRRRRHDTEAGPGERGEHSSGYSEPGRDTHSQRRYNAGWDPDPTAPQADQHAGLNPSTDTVDRPLADAYPPPRRRFNPFATLYDAARNVKNWILERPHYVVLLVPALLTAQLVVYLAVGPRMWRDPTSACALDAEDVDSPISFEAYYDRICPTRFACSVGSGLEAFWRGFQLALRVDLPQMIFLTLAMWITESSGPLSPREKALRAVVLLLPIMGPFWHGFAFFMYARENFCPRLFDPGDQLEDGGYVYKAR